RDLVLPARRDREVDLQEGVRVAVEDRGHAVLLEEVDVLEPVDVLARCKRVEVDVLDERDVLLVREPVPREELGVDGLDLLGLCVRELVVVVAHRLTSSPASRRGSTLAGGGAFATSSSSALIASSRFTSPRISCSVTPGT